MTNRALTTDSPVGKPQLPASLVSILEKETAPDIPWSPPPAVWIDRNREALQTALRALQAAMRPAPPKFIRRILAILAETKIARDGTKAEWAVRSEEYMRLLGSYPADIWQDAADQHSLESKWFPDVSELNAIMSPKMLVRRRQARKLEAMLNGAGCEPVVFTNEDRKRVAGKLRSLREAMKSEEFGR